MTTWFEILLWVGAVAWLLLFVQAMLNWAVVPDLSKISVAEPEKWPLVSILVPARNEERQIRDAVTSFCTQDYPNFEVIVVDDRSTDATADILAELRQRFRKLKVLRGREPPDGSLGKPNALEIATGEAQGDWILAVDADVIYAPDVVRRAMAYALSEQAGMVTLRPRMSSKGILEGILMSSFNFHNCVVAPLFLVGHARSKLIATGAGEFNLIRRDALEACGGFASVRRVVLDDVAMGYRVKRAGFKLRVAFAGPLIYHRMYDGAGDTVRGFTKIVYPTIRKFPWLLGVYFVLGAITSLLPYFAFAAGLRSGSVSIPATISLVLMHAVFAWIAIHFREPWYTIFLNPVRELGWWWIYVRSVVLYHRKGIVWRDRSYASL